MLKKEITSINGQDKQDFINLMLKKKDEDPKPTIEELMAHDYFNEIRNDDEYKAEKER
jgi:hypothetical protein